MRTCIVHRALALIVPLATVAGSMGEAPHVAVHTAHSVVRLTSPCPPGVSTATVCDRTRGVALTPPVGWTVPPPAPAGGGPSGAPAGVQTVRLSAVAAAIDRLSGDSIIAGDNGNAALVTALDTASGAVLYARPLPGFFSAGGEVGNTASFLALDELVSRALVTTIDFRNGAPVAGHVSVLDTRTGALLRTFKTTTVASGLAVAGSAERIFVVNNRLFGNEHAKDGSVSVLDARTGAAVRTVLADQGPKIAAVDALRRHVFVAAQRTDRRTNIPVGPATMSMLDAITGAVQRTVRVPQSPLGMIVDAANRRVLVCTQAEDSAYNSAVTILDAASGSIIRTVRIGSAPIVPLSIGVDERDGRAYVLAESLEIGSWNGGDVTVLDTRSGNLVATVPVRQAEPRSIAVDELSGHVFVTALGRDSHGNYTGPGRVMMLDTRTGAVRHTVRVAPNPGSIAVDERAARVFVASIGVEDPRRADVPVGRGTVTVLDARSGVILHASRVGVSPTLAAVDERRGRALLLDDRGVTVLNTRVYS